MKNSKLQSPSSREDRLANHQIGVASPVTTTAPTWRLKVGAFLVLGCWCLVLLMAALCTNAQSYSIDWFSIDCGGGPSTGGGYTLSGTLGQPDAGTLSGGSYTLEGGFWPGLIVHATTGSPTLLIQVSGASVIISWAPATSGFTLEQTDSLSSPSWSATPNVTTNSATVPTGDTTRFYRLIKQ